jgi:proline dehydrogenase
MNGYLQQAVWNFWNVLGKRAARSYIAGPELGDAVRVAHELSQKGFNTTIGFWNLDNDPHDAVFNQYVRGIEVLRKQGSDSYLSIKLPAIGYSHQLLSPVLSSAKRGGIRVHFDALGPETVDQTWSVIENARSTYDNLSCTLPGRWRRSPKDAAWAVSQGLTVRVIKGQWADPGDPDRDMRAGFLEIIDALAGRVRHVGVASHDAWLARESFARLKAAGTSCEMELVYGLPARDPIKLARELGLTVRFYIPYGNGFLPYCLSWARKNPRVLWWMFKDFVRPNSLPSMR